MKERKYFFGLYTEKTPEKEWEAKYLTAGIDSENKYEGLASIAFFVFLISIILGGFLFLDRPCSVQLEGKVIGNLDLDFNNDYYGNENMGLHNINFTEVNGKVNAQIPCVYVGLFGGN